MLAPRRNASAWASRSSTVIPANPCRIPAASTGSVAVVALVMLGDDLRLASRNLGVGGLPGLAGAQPGVLVGHGG